MDTHSILRLSNGHLPRPKSSSLKQFFHFTSDTLSWIFRQILISWYFIKYDFTVTVLLGMEWTFTAWYAESRTFSSLLEAMTYSFIYFWFYALTHCVSNQLEGIEEDRLNKPDRPLPSEKATVEEAETLKKFAYIGFVIVGYWLNVLPFCLLWLGLVYFGNPGMHRYWYLKNSYSPIGYYSMLKAAWGISFLNPNTPSLAELWMLIIPFLTFFVIAVQDLRDVQGDIAMGRKTMPIVMGPESCRKFLFVTFSIGIPIALYFLLYHSSQGQIAFYVNTLIAVVLALRILLLKTKQQDHDTYLWYVLWFGFIELNAMTVL